MFTRPLLKISVAALAAVPAAAALAEAPAAPDTSNWKCESCPFYKGYDGDATAGAAYPDGANASYGRYTGMDHAKTYADLGAEGSWQNESGGIGSYTLDNLGLDSRSGELRVGQAGRFDVGLSYDGLPYRRYDMTVTPFSGGTTLSLPSNWVAAGTTAGMSSLAADLHRVDVGTLRKRYGIDGRYLFASGLKLFAAVRREQKTGNELLGASFLTQAMQLAPSVDYTTDTFEIGAAWSSRTADVKLVLSDSKFKNSDAALNFANPYLPLVPSAVQGQLALAPGNEARQWNLGGSIALPWNSSVSANVGTTQLKQDAPLLPNSTFVGAPPPPAGFSGDVKLTHAAGTIGMRPLPKLSVHGRLAYDERKDDSTTLSIAQVTTDVAVGAAVTTPRYDFKRLRLDGGIDYRFWRWLTAGIGGDRIEIDRTQQVVQKTEDGRTWGLLKFSTENNLALTLKGGAGHREARGVDLTLLPANENPALSIYNLSNRDRDFGELRVSYSPLESLSLGVQGSAANDVYRRSEFGLIEGRERRIDATLGWSPAEKLSFYLDGGYQKRGSVEDGRYSTASPTWRAELTDRFRTLGIGGHWSRAKWDVTADYTHADSTGATGVGLVGALGSFPDTRTRYDNARFAVGYACSEVLTLRLRYVYQNYASDDWALDGVGPATLPNLIALGAVPDGHNVNMIALAVNYRFGTKAPPPKSE
jgi:MtrB/PioB family decaheme-associated outer membrane protein